MATTKEYKDYILEQLSLCENITCRAMMGEYLLYTNGKLFGGIYDNRFLVKPTESAKARMPEAKEELSYEGAKPMLLVEEVENKQFLKDLADAMYNDLPTPKKKK